MEEPAQMCAIVQIEAVLDQEYQVWE